MYSEGDIQELNEVEQENEIHTAMVKKQVVEEMKFQNIFEEKTVNTISEIKIIKDREKTQKKFRSRKLQVYNNKSK